MQADDEIMVSPPHGRLLIASIDLQELTLLFFEAAYNVTHPEGVSAADALDVVKQHEPEVYAGLHRQAHVAVDYFADCMRNAKAEATN